MKSKVPLKQQWREKHRPWEDPGPRTPRGKKTRMVHHVTMPEEPAGSYSYSVEMVYEDNSEQIEHFDRKSRRQERRLEKERNRLERRERERFMRELKDL